jgi:hypothetical protein
MNTVLVGTIDVQALEMELREELSMVRASLKQLVNSRPFGEHTKQDELDYVSLRNQEELLILELL